MTKKYFDVGDRVRVASNYCFTDLANLEGVVVDFFRNDPTSALVQLPPGRAPLGHNGQGSNQTGESFPNSWFIPTGSLHLVEKKQTPRLKVSLVVYKPTGAIVGYYRTEQNLKEFLQNQKPQYLSKLRVEEFEQTDAYDVSVDVTINKIRKENS